MSVLAIPMGVVLFFGDALATGLFSQPPEVARVSLFALTVRLLLANQKLVAFSVKSAYGDSDLSFAVPGKDAFMRKAFSMLYPPPPPTRAFAAVGYLRYELGWL